MKQSQKLILGGAQIGQNYGAVREASFFHSKEVRALLRAAWTVGFRSVDTARAYGDSEKQIGAAGWLGQVHTKLDESQDPSYSLATSLELLGRERADLLYLCHDAARLPDYGISKWRGILKSLKERVERFGLSLYPNQLTESLIEQDDVRVLQLPFNILSPRFPGHLVKKWKGLGKSIFVRSVFAQGFLLNDATSEGNQRFSEAARVFHQVSDELELPRGEVALRWVLTNRGIDGVVLGVSQLGEIPLIGEWAAKGPLGDDEMLLIEQKISRFRRPFDLRKLT